MIASATATCAVDVAVLGAGPAGIGAAVAAHAAGRSVLLIDEAPAAGRSAEEEATLRADHTRAG